MTIIVCMYSKVYRRGFSPDQNDNERESKNNYFPGLGRVAVEWTERVWLMVQYIVLYNHLRSQVWIRNSSLRNTIFHIEICPVGSASEHPPFKYCTVVPLWETRIPDRVGLTVLCSTNELPDPQPLSHCISYQWDTTSPTYNIPDQWTHF